MVKKNEREHNDEHGRREKKGKQRTKRGMSERKDRLTCCDFHQSETRSVDSSAEVKSDTDLGGNTAR